MMKSEILERYKALKEFMVESRDPKNMKIFGKVADTLMEFVAEHDLLVAEQAIACLEAMRWEQYLTEQEAESVLSKLKTIPWSYSSWKNEMNKSEYQLSVQGCYNEWSLFSLMSALMSMHSATFYDYLDDSEIFAFVHRLATDKLKDKEHYSVRNQLLEDGTDGTNAG